MKARISVLLIMVGAFLLLFSFGTGGARPSTPEKSLPVKSKNIDGRNEPVQTGKKISLRQDDNIVETIEMPVQEKIEKFFASLPRKSSLKNLTDSDVHSTPRPVMIAGEHLASMRDFFVKNPQPINIELEFYLSCSQEKEFFDSVRAVCAARAKKLYTKATGHRLSPAAFEPRIADLSQKISL